MLKAIHASENKEAARAKSKGSYKEAKRDEVGFRGEVGREVCGGDAYVLRVFRRHTGGGSGLTIRWRG